MVAILYPHQIHSSSTFDAFDPGRISEPLAWCIVVSFARGSDRQLPAPLARLQKFSDGVGTQTPQFGYLLNREMRFCRFRQHRVFNTAVVAPLPCETSTSVSLLRRASFIRFLCAHAHNGAKWLMARAVRFWAVCRLCCLLSSQPRLPTKQANRTAALACESRSKLAQFASRYRSASHHRRTLYRMGIPAPSRWRTGRSSMFSALSAARISGPSWSGHTPMVVTPSSSMILVPVLLRRSTADSESGVTRSARARWLPPDSWSFRRAPDERNEFNEKSCISMGVPSYISFVSFPH